jgi:prepilin signal peptidase PulO-like enzyme (type II secretory pathway)
METIADSWIWIPVTFVFYLITTIFTQYVENDYRQQFSMSKVDYAQKKISILVGAIALSIIIYLSQTKLPGTVLPSLGIAAAILCGVYQVDRILLLIPDRFQVVGTFTGILFISLLMVSGEDHVQLMIEAGFALLMVGLLWLMSYIYLRVRGTIGFGLGDIKLLAWLALFVGKRMPNLILIAIFLGICQLGFKTIQSSLKEKKITLPGGQAAFAFGPSIVFAVFIEAIFFYA